jgi:7-cyano-7-deazaguanine synthase
MENKRAVAVLSGGLDSTVATWKARESGYDVVSAITFDYHQRAASREVERAGAFCDFLSIPQVVFPLPELGEFGSSALTDQTQEIPDIESEDLDNFDLVSQVARAVWIPNRNGVLTNISASLAEANNCKYLIVGFNAEEAQTFRDSSITYIKILNRALEYSTANKVEVISPTWALDKSAIARVLCDASIPVSMIWPCYYGGEKWCGTCESCRRTRRAFKTIGQEQYIQEQMEE